MVGKTVVVDTIPAALVVDECVTGFPTSADDVVNSSIGDDVVDEAMKPEVLVETGAAVVVVTTSSTTVLTSLVVPGSVSFVGPARVVLSVEKTRLVVITIAELVVSEKS